MDYLTLTTKQVIISLCALVVFLALPNTNFIFVSAEEIFIESIVSGCGDLIVETGESCDGGNLNSQTCTTLGFSSGVLSCTNLCAFDTSLCTVHSGSSGGGSSSRTNTARSLVAFEGKAMPFGVVTLLIDGVRVATATANQLGQFSFAAKNLDKGSYQFNLYAIDPSGARTAHYSVGSTVKSRSVLKIDGIFLSPTLSTDIIEIALGERLAFYGYTIPTAHVGLIFKDQKERSTVYSATSSSDGSYTVSFDTHDFDRDLYSAISIASQYDSVSSPSRISTVKIGYTTVLKTDGKKTCSGKGDLNRDCFVNLIDFSVLLFWYTKALSEDLSKHEEDFNQSSGITEYSNQEDLLPRHLIMLISQ